jgi:hypothetical protein
MPSTDTKFVPGDHSSPRGESPQIVAVLVRRMGEMLPAPLVPRLRITIEES